MAKTFTDPFTFVQTALDGTLEFPKPSEGLPNAYVDANGVRWSIVPVKRDPITLVDKIVPIFGAKKLLAPAGPDGWTATLPPGTAYSVDPPASLYGHATTIGGYGIRGDDLALTLEAVDNAVRKTDEGFPWWLVAVGVAVYYYDKRNKRRRRR